MSTARRPTRTELLAAAERHVDDLVAPGLRVLFCGINPGLYTAWAGHHFARPGNRFWPAMYAAGFTPRLFRPDEQGLLLGAGYGITNVVARASATADELSPAELRAGGERLVALVRQYRPYCLAVLGIGAYRTAFGQPSAGLGLQPTSIDSTHVWVLPNPSGLNAHYNAAELARLFGELRAWVEASEGMQ